MLKEQVKVEEKNSPKKSIVFGIAAIAVAFTGAILCLLILWGGKDDNEAVPAETLDKAVKVEAPYTCEIILSSERNVICVNEALEIEADIKESFSKDGKLEWFSSNQSVALVKDGTVTAVGIGSAEIYAKKGEVESNRLKINCKEISTELALTEESREILIGQSFHAPVEIAKGNATLADVLWNVENPSVVSVNGGEIKALAVGETTITAVTKERNSTVSFKVKVKPVEVTGVWLDDTDVKLGVGQSYFLYSEVYPYNATYPQTTWTSSNPSVISVDSGNITAVGAGKAAVTIKTSNGVNVSCNFTVTESKPQFPVNYAKRYTYIRSQPNQYSSVIADITRNTEIELLSLGQAWDKVRLTDGRVGYISSSAYSPERIYYVENVPFINQFLLGYPTGCEAVSAAMAAQFAGYNVSSAQIIDKTPTDPLGKREETVKTEVETEVVNEETGETEIVKETKEETVLVASNPFKVFVGHPTKKLREGSYGCYAQPICDALSALGIPNKNLSGCSADTLFKYIKQGKPVVIWCKQYGAAIKTGETWRYPDGSGSYTELVGEHCAVLVGFDGDYVYLNDPATGEGVTQVKSAFVSNWYTLHSQAVVVGN